MSYISNYKPLLQDNVKGADYTEVHSHPPRVNLPFTHSSFTHLPKLQRMSSSPL